MPTATYTPIANVTLSSTASSVTFSGISQAYRDLVLISSGIGTGNINIVARFNGDSGSNYSDAYGYGSGTSAVSGTDVSVTGANLSAAAYWGTTFAGSTINHVMDYSATDKHKIVLGRSNNANTAVDMGASRWANTAAITSITFITSNANSFAAGSSFAIYGVAA